MSRTVVDLDARATVLDAAERVAAASADGDLALVVAAGAPLLRSAVFIDVLRAQVGPRRLSLVTNDARARSLASSVHVPAYATLAALERHELDPTERLAPARRAAIAAVRPPSAVPRPSLRRALGVAGSLAAALLVLAAVVVPEARVVVAPAVAPLGPIDLVVRAAASGGDVSLKPLTAQIGAKVTGNATGVRAEEIRAKGSLQLENKTTDDVRVPKGSVFKTADGLQFLSTADVTLPRSVILPPVTLFLGKVTVGVEAAVAGTGGNVVAGRITIGPDPSRYSVTNLEPTSGGDIKRIALVKLEDYDTAVKRAPDSLRKEAEDQLARWVREPRPGEQVVQQVLTRQTAVAPANVDVVGKESETFELTVSGIATAYIVPDTEPRRAAIGKLREATRSGNVVDENAAVVDVKSVKVAEDGVTWTLTARGAQVRRTGGDQVARLLAGRPAGDAKSVLDAQGVTLVRLERAPPWWPLLPILDGRITVEVTAPPTSRLEGP